MPVMFCMKLLKICLSVSVSLSLSLSLSLSVSLVCPLSISRVSSLSVSSLSLSFFLPLPKSNLCMFFPSLSLFRIPKFYLLLSPIVIL
jgi:hypothetical protein